jgi:hypothetical protein
MGFVADATRRIATACAISQVSSMEIDMAKAKTETETSTKQEETPRERFLRIAPQRTQSSIKRINLLGNLAGGSYQWTPDEAKQIIEALFDAVHDVKRKFEKKMSKGRKGFEFKSKKQKETGE